jgi:phosphoglycerate dehydrogenase-like enzyme
MARVFVFAPSGESHDALQESGCEVVLGDEAWHRPGGNNEAAMIDKGRGAQAMMGTSIRSSPITRGLLAALPDLRIVSKYTVGVDDIDVDAATELGILVTHAPTEANWGGVAEGTVAMMLALLKKLRERDALMKTGGWRGDTALEGTYLGRRMSDGYEGITLGIVGLGRIGGRVAQLMRPWNMRLLAHDPHIPDYRFLEFGAEPVDLDTLLRESDVVSVHVVLTKETRRMIGAKQFAAMKPSAIFLNTARGGAVDEAALVDALERGEIAAAGLDAFEHEPLAPDSALRRMGDNVLLSPHMISVNARSGIVGQGTRWGTEAVLRALRGEVPEHVFNPEAIAAWLQRFGGKNVLLEAPLSVSPPAGPA